MFRFLCASCGAKTVSCFRVSSILCSHCGTIHRDDQPVYRFGPAEIERLESKRYEAVRRVVQRLLSGDSGTAHALMWLDDVESDHSELQRAFRCFFEDRDQTAKCGQEGVRDWDTILARFRSLLVEAATFSDEPPTQADLAGLLRQMSVASGSILRGVMVAAHSLSDELNANGPMGDDGTSASAVPRRPRPKPAGGSASNVFPQSW